MDIESNKKRTTLYTIIVAMCLLIIGIVGISRVTETRNDMASSTVYTLTINNGDHEIYTDSTTGSRFVYTEAYNKVALDGDFSISDEGYLALKQGEYVTMDIDGVISIYGQVECNPVSDTDPILYTSLDGVTWTKESFTSETLHNTEGANYIKFVNEISDTDYEYTYIFYELVITYSCVTKGEISPINDYYHGVTYTLSETGDYYKVSDFWDYSTLETVTVTDYINGIPVTEIESEVFAGKPFTSVTLPHTLETIGFHAFYNCSSLATVNITHGAGNKSSLKTIGEGAFNECTSLAYFPFEVTTELESVGKNAFSSTKITSVVLPSSVTNLGDSAFSYCRAIITADLSKTSVTSLPTGLFYYCTSMTSILLPSTVTSFGYYTFGRCSSITSIEIPSGVTVIGSESFDSCTSLKSIVLPEGITTISYAAFQNCTSLTSIIIPSSITYIGAYCFAGSGLTSATFKEVSGWIGTSSYGTNYFNEEELSDTAKSAELLASSYRHYVWTRSE